MSIIKEEITVFDFQILSKMKKPSTLSNFCYDIMSLTLGLTSLHH